nr:cell envelope integrity protein TolA [uncultured Noviherbaspirillum sp.]
MKDATPYTIPKEPGGWRSFTLAVLVHLALLALLWIGVRWQNETPTAVEAEIWSPQAQQAAPKPQSEPEPVQPPPPPARVVEAPKPQPAPPPVERPVEKPAPNPDIALEQEKKRRLKEEKERREEEEREERAAQKLAQEKKEQADARKKELARAEADKERRLEAERERKLEQQAAQKREAEEEKKRELAEAAEAKRKQAEAEKKRAQAKAEAEAAEQRRVEDLARMTAQATGSGGSGQAARSQGPSRGDAGYAAKVAGKIRSNTVFNVPDELANNPAVEYAVDLLPDGSVRGIRKVKGSGVPGFDEAVRRAIEKSQPFPPDNSGRAPSGFTVSHKPKDQ